MPQKGRYYHTWLFRMRSNPITIYYGKILTYNHFLRNEQLNKVTVSRAFYELWKHKDIQSEENDCNHLFKILNELLTEDLDNERKNHLKSLQTIDKSQCKFIIAPSETRRHKEWIESENNRVITATNITDTLLQETKRNVFRKISKASENALVDVITRIIEASIYQMPVDFDIEVTRNDRQSIASKKRKNRQETSSRGNKPDLMIRAFFKNKWNELAYVESGKWRSTDTKTLNDHNKLARLSLDGYTDMSKKTKKNELYKFCIIFGINITDDHCIVIHGFLREKGIKFYLPIIKAKIPFHNETVDEVEEFVHALLILRNGILVNLHETSHILDVLILLAI
ncbi:8167_t:CDS:2 [Acaulospora morrowiae]|uniref:8167_t:CDS:1 n=1 Tax=Acaulospora morrowiae TaxID=94023 RepID=A0A9N8W803_9GLOM|nr:8167_t:CDS:2 [Acaulospora morrowiae]